MSYLISSKVSLPAGAGKTRWATTASKVSLQDALLALAFTDLRYPDGAMSSGLEYRWANSRTILAKPTGSHVTALWVFKENPGVVKRVSEEFVDNLEDKFPEFVSAIADATATPLDADTIKVYLTSNTMFHNSRGRMTETLLVMPEIYGSWYVVSTDDYTFLVELDGDEVIHCSVDGSALRHLTWQLCPAILWEAVGEVPFQVVPAVVKLRKGVSVSMETLDLIRAGLMALSRGSDDRADRATAALHAFDALYSDATDAPLAMEIADIYNGLEDDESYNKKYQFPVVSDSMKDAVLSLLRACQLGLAYANTVGKHVIRPEIDQEKEKRGFVSIIEDDELLCEHVGNVMSLLFTAEGMSIHDSVTPFLYRSSGGRAALGLSTDLLDAMSNSLSSLTFLLTASGSSNPLEGQDLARLEGGDVDLTLDVEGQLQPDIWYTSRQIYGRSVYVPFTEKTPEGWCTYIFGSTFEDEQGRHVETLCLNETTGESVVRVLNAA